MRNRVKDWRGATGECNRELNKIIKKKTINERMDNNLAERENDRGKGFIL